ncbi:hypothetical protein [Anaerobiospirillum thomasii]|uniref:Uncharacterized protein n=1 Tax=Anaerobiospirillum thomasii TaxID=179995 RepID=A0A2X0XN73_9GAMM|nr:hypothetical protein [Anaerobiospirillum thomasii]SPT78881.1 Uncharacterised protein [Anaerobiospirillum thomasii]
MNKYRVLVKELNDAYDIASNWQEVIAGKEPSELTAAHTNLLKDKLVDLFQYSDEVADTDSSFDKRSSLNNAITQDTMPYQGYADK